MKVERITVLNNKNKQIPFLYNKVKDAMDKAKSSGTISNIGITIERATKETIEELKSLGIKFKRD